MTTEELDALIERYYAMPGNDAGGNLHIVLDDSNLDDECISWCLAKCSEQGDDMGAQIATELLKLPEAQRWTMKFVCPCCRASYEAGDLPP